MGHGLNDYSSSATGNDGKAATFATETKQVIACIRAKFPGRPISFVLLSTHERGDAAFADEWAAYVAAKEQIAAADDDVVHFDLGKRMPPALVSGGSALKGAPDAAITALGLYADPAHPLAKGYGVAGDAMAEFAIPR